MFVISKKGFKNTSLTLPEESPILWSFKYSKDSPQSRHFKPLRTSENNQKLNGLLISASGAFFGSKKVKSKYTASIFEKFCYVSIIRFQLKIWKTLRKGKQADLIMIEKAKIWLNENGFFRLENIFDSEMIHFKWSFLI